MASPNAASAPITQPAAAKLQHIHQVAASLGLRPEDLLLFGDHKAKIKMAAIERILHQEHEGRLVLVSAVNPTDAGEGKTTCSIGLAQALHLLGEKTAVTLREPSMGPCFGRKGGGTGGGCSQVQPMAEINLHFTGDFHAVAAAHNLIAAALDNYFYFAKNCGLKPGQTFWRRVMDVNDRSLRDIVVGLAGNGISRQTGFDITPASEIMAILCLSKNYAELRQKIANILLGVTDNGEPFTVNDLQITGAATALLKEALLPNLVQTSEHCPAFVHGGPFANIAQGTNSILATKLALKLSDFVVTEAGFGSDLGAEKFLDIVCPYGDYSPAAVVLVVTTGALKLHGGVSKRELRKPNLPALYQGAENLQKHLENARHFQRPVVVAINRSPHDSEQELASLQEICQQLGVESSIVQVYQQGGRGGRELAEKVRHLTKSDIPRHKPLYNWQASVKDKIATIAREIYGACDVEYLPAARKSLKLIKQLDYEHLPICMAKTHKSLSDNPRLLGKPQDFVLKVREIIISAGAGFLVPLTGEILRMPGLPATNFASRVNVDERGEIMGLF